MKKFMIAGIAMAMGVLSVGAASASAAGSCCNSGTCADAQAVQRSSQETATLSSALKAKEYELREQYGNEGMDIHKVNDLEAAIKELKSTIKQAADKNGLPDCCRG